MVKHFGINSGKTACGRSGGFVSAVSLDQVTCKGCRATMAYRAAVEAQAPVGPIVFEAWRCKLRNGERLPRGKFFAGKSAGLQAYQVGDGDVVAAYSPEGAIAVLCAQTGDEPGVYELDEVELIGGKRLNCKKYFDTELGRVMRTETSLRQDLRALEKPSYLHGWAY